MIYLQLLGAFFIIGLASFGGGYAAMSLIQAQVVTQYGWLSAQGFADLVTLSEMTPGPVAINAATFVGMRGRRDWGRPDRHVGLRIARLRHYRPAVLPL